MTQPSETREQTHEVAIKPEFLIECWQPEADVSKQDRSKKRGQNKKREFTKSFDAIQICKEFLSNACEKGDKCKRSHDIKKYIESKGSDIGENCFLFETYGYCKFGVTCRFASSHLDDNLNNIKNESIHKKLESTFLNVLTHDQQKLARTRKLAELPLLQEATKLIDERTRIRNEIDVEVAAIKAIKKPEKELELKIAEDRNEENDFKKAELELSSEAQLAINSHSEKIERLNLEMVNCKLPAREKKKLDLRGKTWLAPLTTVGNLPFRRICKKFGVDVTTSEMAMAESLVKGNNHEWALARRHESEDIFGLQICGNDHGVLARAGEIISEFLNVDFVDLNLGCPIDGVVKQGAGAAFTNTGSALLTRPSKLDNIVTSLNHCLNDIPLTIKIRTGLLEKKRVAHQIVAKEWDLAAITLHGRSQQARYSKLADWEYIGECGKSSRVPFFGNGDIYTQSDYYEKLDISGVSGCMIGRGALQKPWLFTEIKEKRIWDITSTERLDILKDFCNYGMEQWGSDTVGVNTTRRFLCEWLSHLYRYVPVGVLLDAQLRPQVMNHRPPPFKGRNELETLMASPNCADWIKISEMVLGPCPESFIFTPKHKSSAWEAS